VLANYDIQDHATLRAILSVRADLQVLAGNQDAAALATLAQIKDLEDKPDAKLLSSLRLTAFLKARMATGQGSGPAFEKAYADNLTAALAPLPWAVVGTGVKEAKTSVEIGSKALYLGEVQAGIEPAVAKSHELSNDLAWGLVALRVSMTDLLPLKDASLAVLAKDVAANNVQKPDILGRPRRHPRRHGPSDAGAHRRLGQRPRFLRLPGLAYTDPHAAPQFDPHGLAFDLVGLPTHGELLPLDAAQAAAYPAFRGLSEGLLRPAAVDRQPRGQRPEKDSSPPWRPVEVPTFLENLELYSVYVHGTHVAGISSRGNPAARLALGGSPSTGITCRLSRPRSWRSAPPASYAVYVKWFKDHGIRVVNMSWGGTPQDYEAALEKNGVGKEPPTSARRWRDTCSRSTAVACWRR